MNSDTEALTLGSVRISEKGISELSDGTPVVEIPKGDISRIELTRTTGAERPLAQFIFGLALAAPGFFFSRVLWSWLLFGGTLYVDITFWFILLIPVGLWLAITAFRQRILLLVHTATDRRKVVFRGNFTVDEIVAFVDCAKERFRYQIQTSLRN
jgi:hypothetical protein